MAHISFLDETCRDGQQSLWGMRMQAGQVLKTYMISWYVSTLGRWLACVLPALLDRIHPTTLALSPA